MAFVVNESLKTGTSNLLSSREGERVDELGNDVRIHIRVVNQVEAVMRTLNCCRKRANWYFREQHAIIKSHSVTGWFTQMQLTEGVNGNKTLTCHIYDMLSWEHKLDTFASFLLN